MAYTRGGGVGLVAVAVRIRRRVLPVVLGVALIGQEPIRHTGQIDRRACGRMSSRRAGGGGTCGRRRQRCLDLHRLDLHRLGGGRGAAIGASRRIIIFGLVVGCTCRRGGVVEVSGGTWAVAPTATPGSREASGRRGSRWRGRGGRRRAGRPGGVGPRAHIQTAFTPMSIPMCLPPYRLGVAQLPHRGSRSRPSSTAGSARVRSGSPRRSEAGSVERAGASLRAVRTVVGLAASASGIEAPGLLGVRDGGNTGVAESLCPHFTYGQSAAFGDAGRT